MNVEEDRNESAWGAAHRRVILPIFVLGLMSHAPGCTRYDSAPAVDEATPSGESPGPIELSTTLFLRISLDEPTIPEGYPVGPLRILVEQRETSQRTEGLLAEIVEEWPLELEVDSLPDGPIRITVYQDSDGDAFFDGCPFPPRPSHTEELEKRDGLVGIVNRADGNYEKTVEVSLRNSICGPGSPETGVSGTVAFPDGVNPSNLPIYMYLQPTVSEQSPTEELIQPLRIPLYETGESTASRRFSVGEVLPGKYDITIFTDTDGDHSPTPCGPELGGADRYSARIENVEIIAGQRRNIDTPLTLRAAGCPEVLTGVRGYFGIEPELVANAQWSEPGSPWTLLEGAAYVSLVSASGDADELSWRLLPTVATRPLPQVFTVSGIPPGLWRLELFLDRDNDGRFLPCNGIPAGFDMVYVIKEDIRVRDGELTDIGLLTLSATDCGNEPISGIRGLVTVESESGPEGSGRPVRLELYPLGTPSERLSFRMFDNHSKLPPEGARFSQEVPVGSYRGRFYLDTNRDGDFGECTIDPFADRNAGPPFVIDLSPGALVDLGLQAIASLSCPVLLSSLTLNILPPEDLPEANPNDLRVLIRELGGWEEDRPLEVTVDDIWESRPLDLPSGVYHLVAYLDDDGDGSFRPCESDGGDTIFAEVIIEMDGTDPGRSVGLALELNCP